MLTSTTRAPRGRRGFTLVELLIALTVLGLIGTALTTAIMRQQRINTRTTALIDTRNQGRITVGALAQELRGLSSIGGDIVGLSATSLEVRAPIATSVVCAIDAGRTTLTLPTERTLAAGHVLTSFVDPDALPKSGDWVFMYNPVLAVSAPWDSTTVSNAGTTKGAPAACPAGAGNLVATAADGLHDDYELSLTAAAPAGVAVGSAVRILRRVRYRFAQEAAGQPYYLYYAECPNGVCGTDQALSGPFRPQSADTAATGFRFRYFDTNGLETATPSAVARIDIITRPMSRDRVSNGTGTRDYLTQHEYVSVAIRNRT